MGSMIELNWGKGAQADPRGTSTTVGVTGVGVMLALGKRIGETLGLEWG